MDIETIKTNSNIVDNNDNKQTLSMYLASNGIIPPEIFNHEKDKKDNNEKTVQDYFIDNNIDVPKQWQTNYKIQQKVQEFLNDYCETYNIIKKVIIQNIEWQDNDDKYTFAMYLVMRNIIPPKQFIHDSNIKGGLDNKTVRQYLEDNYLPIPNEWYDDEYKQNHEYKPECINSTFYGILTKKDNNIDPETQYENKYTVAMIYASQGIIPPQCWNHDPNLQNCEGNTVAMLLIKNKIFNIPQQWHHNPETQNNEYNDSQTIAMIYANEGKIPPKEWQHRPELQNNTGDTVAMMLAYKEVIPPEDWEHSPYIANQVEKTVQDYLQHCDKEIPNQWKIINKQIKITDQIQQILKEYCEKYGIQNQQIIINYPQYQKYDQHNTFAIELEINDIQIPKEFQYIPEYRLFNNDTTAMKLANVGKIPSKIWYHDPSIQNNNGKTVAMYLAQNGIISYGQWQHNPMIQDNNGFTVAMYLAQNNITPPQQWYHESELQNNDKYTVAMLLVKNNVLNILQCWQHDSSIKNIDQKTVAMIYAENGQIPPKEWKHDSLIQDNEGFTVAMYLVKNSIIPTQEWYHNKNIRNKYGFTVQDYLQYNNIEIQTQWKTINYNVQNENIIKYLIDFCEYYKIDKDIIIQNPQWQYNEYKQTFAMKLAFERINISKQFEHDPKIQDNNGNTVAILLAYNSIIPPKEWYHNPYIANNDEKTVQDYLMENNIQVPEQWKVVDKQIQMTEQIQQKLEQYCIKYDIQNQQIVINYPQYQKNSGILTFAMYLAQNGILPPEEFEHDPNIKDNNGITIAFYLALRNIIPSKQWQVNPNIMYKYENNNINNNYDIYIRRTIAQQLAFKGNIPPQEWYHDSQLQDSEGFTVAMHLASKEIIPPKEWEHNPQIKNKYNKTVEDYLEEYKMNIPDNWKVKQINSQIENYLNEFCKRYKVNKQVIINNPSWQDNTDKYTFAMYLALFKKTTIHKQFEHDAKLQSKSCNTVATYLEKNNILVPKQWQYDSNYRLKNDYTTAMMIAQQGKIPSQCWNHDPCLVDSQNKMTVAMYLARNGIIPPKEWYHESYLEDSKRNTVADYLQKNNIRVPDQLKTIQLDIQIQRQLNEYCNRYNINRQTIIINPEWQKNNQKNTFAMYLADNKIIPPKEFKHRQIIQDKLGDTVAVYLERKGIEVSKEWKYDPLFKLQNNNTTAIRIAEYGTIPSKYWYHDPQLQNNYGNTVAVYLEVKYIQTPQCWRYNPLYKLRDKKTTAMKIASYGKVPSKYWEHDPTIKDRDGFTVEFYLAYNKLTPPKQWQADPNIIYRYKENDKYFERTIAHILASKGIIPPKQYQHNFKLKDNLGNIVQDYLEQNNIQVPEQWNINKQIQMTEQIQQQLEQYCNLYSIQDQQIIINDPSYKNSDTDPTFSIWLALNKIIPPIEFQHDQSIQNQNGFTVAIALASNGIQPPQYWNHKSDLQDNNGCTVAMYLAQNGITPPKQWQHNPNLKNNFKNTVEDYLKQNNIEIPNQWKIINQVQHQFYKIVEEKLQQYCQKYNINRQIIINNPGWQMNKDKQTFAMYLAWKGILPPKQFEHNSKIQNKYGNTVAVWLEIKGLQVLKQWKYDSLYKLKDNRTTAMKIAEYGIIPLQYWCHDPSLKDNSGKTVEDYLEKNNIKIPYYWKVKKYQNPLNYTQLDIERYFKDFCKQYKIILKQKLRNNPRRNNNEDEMTFAMYLAQHKIIPPKEWEHDPRLKDKNGNTVAFYLERNDIETPQQWQYNTEYILTQNYTTAMRVAYYCKIPSQCWNHNSILTDKIWKRTVALLLAQNGIVPPKQWQHDPKLKDKCNRTVQDYLKEKNIEVPDQWEFN